MARRTASRSIGQLFRATKLLVWLNVGALAALGGWYVLQPATRQKEVSLLVQNAFIREKRVSPIDVVWDLWQLYYASGTSVAAGLAGDRTFLIAGVPQPTTFAHGSVRLLRNRAYVVGYSEALQSPVWAGYRVNDLVQLRPAPPRPDHFDVDRRTLAKVAPESYTRSNYDRGHLAPNYAIGTRFGEEAQRETFLMSNVVPQRHSLNAGIWKELEGRIATSYPARYQEVWVLCGPIFSPRPSRLAKGVAVPDSFFMIIVDETEGRVRSMAFVFPQSVPEHARLESYGTSIDVIESLTGFDFLAELEDNAEAPLEAMQTVRPW